VVVVVVTAAAAAAAEDSLFFRVTFYFTVILFYLKRAVYDVGETGFSWHTFHFLIFCNFHTNDTKKKMVLVARVILRLWKKI
jgi:hypothetical protein